MSFNGKCPCGCQIMVRDSGGTFRAFKPNYRQIYVMHENGVTKIKKAVCAECFEKGEYPGAVMASGYQGHPIKEK